MENARELEKVNGLFILNILTNSNNVHTIEIYEYTNRKKKKQKQKRNKRK